MKIIDLTKALVITRAIESRREFYENLKIGSKNYNKCNNLVILENDSEKTDFVFYIHNSQNLVSNNSFIQKVSLKTGDKVYCDPAIVIPREYNIKSIPKVNQLINSNVCIIPDKGKSFITYTFQVYYNSKLDKHLLIAEMGGFTESSTLNDNFPNWSFYDKEKNPEIDASNYIYEGTKEIIFIEPENEYIINCLLRVYPKVCFVSEYVNEITDLIPMDYNVFTEILNLFQSSDISLKYQGIKLLCNIEFRKNPFIVYWLLAILNEFSPINSASSSLKFVFKVLFGYKKSIYHFLKKENVYLSEAEFESNKAIFAFIYNFENTVKQHSMRKHNVNKFVHCDFQGNIYYKVSPI
jgi:hypothetical protein